MSEHQWPKRECCDETDFGGSHYHCARCNGVTGMYGHMSGGRFVDGKWRQHESHFCCPDDCDQPGAHR